MVSTFPTLYLMGKFGRKSLLWTLSFVQAILLVGLGISYLFAKDSSAAQGLAVFFVMAFVFFFELSLGPVPWVYMSETMTERDLSLGVALNWVFTIVIGLLTPILLDKIGGYFFIGNGVFTVICALFCLFILKETKGLSEKEVAVLYSREKLSTTGNSGETLNDQRGKKYEILEDNTH